MSVQPVSVIIPTYNRGYRIAHSIQSVLNQSHSELEVIVVDDGSTDDTRELIAAIGDSRIKYHRLEENRGAANARNVGVSLASYDIIAFNDSDDIWHPDKLEKQLSYWKDNPECVSELKSFGAYIQINCDSILQNDTKKICETAKILLRNKCVDIVCSDAHDMSGRIINMKKCFFFVKKKFGLETAKLLFHDNAEYLIKNEYLA